VALLSCAGHKRHQLTSQPGLKANDALSPVNQWFSKALRDSKSIGHLILSCGRSCLPAYRLLVLFPYSRRYEELLPPASPDSSSSPLPAVRRLPHKRTLKFGTIFLGYCLNNIQTAGASTQLPVFCLVPNWPHVSKQRPVADMRKRHASLCLR
jgi:hypothetical protein